MAKIYERSSCTIIPQGNEKDSSDPRSQTLSGEDSTWMVDRPDIAGVLDCFFFLLIARLNCFGCLRTCEQFFF